LLRSYSCCVAKGPTTRHSITLAYYSNTEASKFIALCLNKPSEFDRNRSAAGRCTTACSARRQPQLAYPQGGRSASTAPARRKRPADRGAQTKQPALKEHLGQESHDITWTAALFHWHWYTEAAADLTEESQKCHPHFIKTEKNTPCLFSNLKACGATGPLKENRKQGINNNTLCLGRLQNLLPRGNLTTAAYTSEKACQIQQGERQH